VILLVMKFCHFVKKKIKKILSQIPCFKRKFNKFREKKKRFAKNCHNCLQHERLLKIFHFPTLNSAKLGQIYIWMIVTWAILKNWKNKIWCYSFNLCTSCKRRRLEYTYFGTVQTLMKLIWDGPTKGKKLNFWGLITKGGKENHLGSPGPTTH